MYRSRKQPQEAFRISNSSSDSLDSSANYLSHLLQSAEIDYLHENLVFTDGINFMLVQTGEGNYIKLCTIVENYIKKKSARQE